VLERLDAAGIDVWVQGGWGVDALVGRETREHEDLDVAIAVERIEDVANALAPLGFAHDPSVQPGLPARYVLVDQDGRQVDVHPLRFDENGDGWQDLGNGRRGRHSAGGLSGSGTIGGRQVRCCTAELQRAFHRGYEHRDVDRHDLGLLDELDG
jgi:lincosamide nucleotidyltransferase A/C/D/E